MWKLLYQSVPGTSHARSGQPCQDHCQARAKNTAEGPVAVLLCSDGAGSAAHSDFASRTACRSLMRYVTDDLSAGLSVRDITRDRVTDWHLRLRKELEEHAAKCKTELSHLACTLLAAVVSPAAAAFSQVGDGAIVVRDGAAYRPVFWPQSGEFINTTCFVTDNQLADRLMFDRWPAGVEEVALFTDGLQMLALNFAQKKAHGPFFEPLFRKLRHAASPDALNPSLKQFLDSPQVNSRCDDDKTLILATRSPARP
ncbi:MAG TPA: PP2C family serine/threonine-protein phosphatase [Gemmataceae bacterium]|nr:PP2C family serine/threonine-protein phosphatase [Gemmataceae bacterium]